ncbi:hypothetical protein PVAP13_8KG032500 [Panicum virgatum]|uniref:Glycosyltransferase n=1 Tax=Panicum virgatum TaxID=38727 RepID=A0A8T0PP81_PANVG|nr:hypothetical protein PVAP13_8KG032500 [Panicum virgatum]
MADDDGRSRRHHFLLVAYGFQSHINPGRVLAHRLARLGGADGSISATLSVPAATYRCMFPSPDADAAAPETEATTDDGVISYVPYSDGVDDGSVPRDAADWAARRRATSASLSAVPVTCIMCTVVFLPALDVARELDIPVTIYWIQTAALLAINYHYFVHGYGELIAAHPADPAHEVRLPGLSRPLQIGNLPSYQTDMLGSEGTKAFIEVFQEFFQHIGQWQPKVKVLVNTLDELERSALAEMKRHLEVFTVGPMVGSSTETRIHLFKHDDRDKKRYMEWLQGHPDKSVVYVSFGSLSKYTKHQMDEIVGGLRQCGRPYLLVVRRDGLADYDDESGDLEKNTQSKGMVVDWGNQLEVLSHPAVGCFVSHCGWNSTMEAMVSGVPIIGAPNMFDQPTNMLFIEEWELGIKAESNSGGVLMGTELARCIELVMGEGAKAMAIREKAKALRLRRQQQV